MSNVYINGKPVTGAINNSDDLRRQLCCPKEAIRQEPSTDGEYRFLLSKYSLDYRRPGTHDVLRKIVDVSDVSALPIFKDPAVRQALSKRFIGFPDKFFDEPYMEAVERNGFFALEFSAGWIENPLSTIVVPKSPFATAEEKWIDDWFVSENRISQEESQDEHSKFVVELTEELRYIPWTEDELHALLAVHPVNTRYHEMLEILLHEVTSKKTQSDAGRTSHSERTALISLWQKACQVADMNLQSTREDEIQRALENLIPDRPYPGLAQPFRCNYSLNHRYRFTAAAGPAADPLPPPSARTRQVTDPACSMAELNPDYVIMFTSSSRHSHTLKINRECAVGMVAEVSTEEATNHSESDKNKLVVELMLIAKEHFDIDPSAVVTCFGIHLNGDQLTIQSLHIDASGDTVKREWNRRLTTDIISNMKGIYWAVQHILHAIDRTSKQLQKMEAKPNKNMIDRQGVLAPPPVSRQTRSGSRSGQQTDQSGRSGTQVSPQQDPRLRSLSHAVGVPAVDIFYRDDEHRTFVGEGTHPVHGTVCLKFVRKRRAAREAKMLSQLQDVPGVVKLLGQCLSSPDGDADEEALGVLMLELVNPLTLYSDRSEQLVQIIKSLIQTLTACHQRGVMHADVLPRNVMSSMRDGSPVLIDFGNAVRFSPPHYPQRAGCHEYEAPPHALDGAYGPEVDFFMLGLCVKKWKNLVMYDHQQLELLGELVVSLQSLPVCSPADIGNTLLSLPIFQVSNTMEISPSPLSESHPNSDDQRVPYEGFPVRGIQMGPADGRGKRLRSPRAQSRRMLYGSAPLKNCLDHTPRTVQYLEE